MSDSQKPSRDEKTNLATVVKSVFAAIFGVQSNKNRERDFKQGDATNFIIVGVVMVFLMVIGVALVVNQVMPN